MRNLRLPTSLGGGELPLGSFPNQLSAVIAHDQAARYYSVASRHMDVKMKMKITAQVERGASPSVIVNFKSDADARNWAKTSKPKPKRYRGVRELPNGCYMARITVLQKQIKLGEFDTLELAARAYDQAALKYQGLDAILNFPDEAHLPENQNASKAMKHEASNQDDPSKKLVANVAAGKVPVQVAPSRMQLEHLTTVKLMGVREEFKEVEVEIEQPKSARPSQQ